VYTTSEESFCVVGTKVLSSLWLPMSHRTKCHSRFPWTDRFVLDFFVRLPVCVLDTWSVLHSRAATLRSAMDDTSLPMRTARTSQRNFRSIQWQSPLPETLGLPTSACISPSTIYWYHTHQSNFSLFFFFSFFLVNKRTLFPGNHRSLKFFSLFRSAHFCNHLTSFRYPVV